MHIHPGLAEISSFTNQFLAPRDFDEASARFFRGDTIRIAGGETAREATERFTLALADIAAQNREAQNLGIVTHGGILAFFTAQYCDTSPLELSNQIGTADLSVFDWQRKKFSAFWRGGL